MWEQSEAWRSSSSGEVSCEAPVSRFGYADLWQERAGCKLPPLKWMLDASQVLTGGSRQDRQGEPGRNREERHGRYPYPSSPDGGERCCACRCSAGQRNPRRRHQGRAQAGLFRFHGPAEPSALHRADLSDRRHPARPIDGELQHLPAAVPAGFGLCPARPVRGDRPLRDQPPSRARHGHLLEACARCRAFARHRPDRAARRSADGRLPHLAVQRLGDLSLADGRCAARILRGLHDAAADHGEWLDDGHPRQCARPALRHPGVLDDGRLLPADARPACQHGDRGEDLDGRCREEPAGDAVLGADDHGAAGARLAAGAGRPDPGHADPRPCQLALLPQGRAAVGALRFAVMLGLAPSISGRMGR
ncbi:hypothetical protein BOS5A_110120 [Bosea sp. EC-HK365B]|nr:hypothetical protein BOSE7B_10085 [Bosea sp. 7B]CAD5247121.1 hypothetical protein BOSE21B_10120 [Bosea sp. 21B]VVT50799.1 hypothetical protein BOS5A_110120 [Bosea sp. EC-HK365B]VXA96506.1 hypothetical protein BOSE127_10086 [Bosea sp. 127]